MSLMHWLRRFAPRTARKKSSPARRRPGWQVAAPSFELLESRITPTVFTNPAPIVINDANSATPFPSDIAVSGLAGPITDVNVILNSVSHSLPGDIDILLVGPGGRTFLLVSDAGDAPNANVTITFDDQAAAPLGLAGSWGGAGANVTFQPANYSGGDADAFNSPAPPAPYASPAPSGGDSLGSVFNGIDPNGTWSLFIEDDSSTNAGLVNGGWSLDFTLLGPDLQISKDDGVGSATPGETVTYTITVTNAGPMGVFGARVTDNFPAELTNVVFTATATGNATGFTSSGADMINDVVNMPAGSSIVYTATGTIISSATGSLTNTAQVDPPAGFSDAKPGDNTASDTDELFPRVDLVVTKDDAPDPVFAGQEITYTITITNNGPSDAAGVTLADAVPANTTFVSANASQGTAGLDSGGVAADLGTIAAGANAIVTIVVRVDATLPDGSAITNTATANTTTNEPDGTNNTATTATIVSAVDLAVTKSATPNPVLAGNELTYTIIVQNNAANTAAASVALTDAVPSGTTFVSFTAPAGWNVTTPAVGATGNVNATIGSLAAGDLATFTLVVRVDSGFSDEGGINNTADVANSIIDSNPSNDSNSVNTSVSQLADLVVTKTDAPDPVIAGQNITYSVTVTNEGPSDAQGVTVDDVVPANTTFVSSNPSQGASGLNSNIVHADFGIIAAGASATLTIVVRTNANLADGTKIDNSATAATTTTEVDLSDNTGAASTAVSAVELSVTKTDAPDPVPADSNLTYTITVTNNAPNTAARNLVLSDAVPANTTFVSLTAPAGWNSITPAVGAVGNVTSTIQILAAGASAVFTLVVRVDLNAPVGSDIYNQATIANLIVDSNPGNNLALTTTTVAPVARADLSVTKAGPATAPRRTNLSYQITVTNLGPGTARDVVLADALPPLTTFVTQFQTSGPAFALTNTATTIRNTLAVLPAGASATFTVIVFAPVPGTLVNTINVSGSTTDPQAANNSAAIVTLVGTKKQRWTAQVHRDLFYREARPSELATANVVLNSPGNPVVLRHRVATQILSSLLYQAKVTEVIYWNYLDNGPDSGDCQHFLDRLLQGATLEQVRAEILGSQEYFRQQGGGTNAGWVAALYQDVLRRAPTNAEVANVLAMLQSATRQSIALQLLNSNEGRRVLISRWYQRYLGRAPSAAEVQRIIAELRSGVRDEAIIARILASPEYFRNV